MLELINDYTDAAVRNDIDLYHSITFRTSSGWHNNNVITFTDIYVNAQGLGATCLKGRRRDGAGLLSGPARQRPWRSAALGQRRRAGDHRGDRGMLSAIGAPALPGAPDAQSRSQGPDRSIAGVQGAGDRLLLGAFAGDCAPTGGWHPRRLRRSPAERDRRRSRRWPGHPSPAFPADPCLDHYNCF
jgi:hypothetical protein